MGSSHARPFLCFDCYLSRMCPSQPPASDASLCSAWHAGQEACAGIRPKNTLQNAPSTSSTTSTLLNKKTYHPGIKFSPKRQVFSLSGAEIGKAK